VLSWGTGQPPSLADFHGIVWTGSNMTIHKPDDLVRGQIDLSRAAFSQGVPQFGSCWAAQLAAVAAGGACGPNPKGREFGVARDITLTAAGRAHPMMAGRPAIFDGFTSHADIVTSLPEGAVLLAGNDFATVQALAVERENGTFWAIQYHPEYDTHEVARLADLRREPLIAQGTFTDHDDADAFIGIMEAVNRSPGRADLAEELGLAPALLSRDNRLMALRNWLDACILKKGDPHG
jgi:GMP synthase (glutamine-hydrolysing)